MSALDSVSPNETRQVSVLVVEDSPEFQQMIHYAVSNANYHVECADDGESALEIAAQKRPDVVVLDIELPGIDGIEVCRRLRTFSDAYVIMLTGRGAEIDRLSGLGVGADDYMTKPFSLNELLARIQALLRRPRNTAEELSIDRRQSAKSYDHLCVDALSREVRLDGEEVSLTRIEFDLLAELLERPAMVYTPEMLLERVWGTTWAGSDHLIQVHIANLRRKIDTNGRKHIKTVRGIGYRFQPTGV